MKWKVVYMCPNEIMAIGPDYKRTIVVEADEAKQSSSGCCFYKDGKMVAMYNHIVSVEQV